VRRWLRAAFQQSRSSAHVWYVFTIGLLDPSLVLRLGYAWLTDPQGHTLSSVAQMAPGQAVRATLADGEVDLTVSSTA
jgi:exonuclease VII large subunit